MKRYLLNKKILIIDDNREFTYLISRQLKKNLTDIKILTEDDGNKGVDAARKEMPDLIMLDINLPGIDGYQVIKILKEDKKTGNIPIIMITAFGNETKVYSKVLESGADFFLSKPVELSELLAQINALMRLREAESRILKEKDILEELVVERTLELRISEDRYKRITEAISDYIYTVTFNERGEAKETFHGEACFAVTGYSVEDFNNNQYLWLDMIYQDDKEMVLSQIRQIFDKHVFNPIEHRIIDKRGRIKWVKNTPVPFFKEGGRLFSYDGVIHDITEIKTAEIRNQNILQIATDGFIIYDNNGSFKDINDSFCEIVGISRTELFKMGIYKLFIEGVKIFENKESMDSFLEDVRKSGISIKEFKLTVNGNKLKYVESKNRREFENEKELFYCVFRDITGKKADDEESRKNEMQLIQSEKMASIGLLISGIAHEINNPNNFILFNSSIIIDIWKDIIKLFENNFKENELTIYGMPFNEIKKNLTDMLNGILEGSLRIKNIVGALKEYIQPSDNVWDQNVNINTVINSAAVIVNHLIKQTTDNFFVEYADDLPLIRGNAQQFEQVIINLIVNACQSLTSRDQKINIYLQYDKKKSIISVIIKDQGAGISKENLKRIKEPFFSTKLKSGGTGLGLFISNKIIEKFAGSMDFESEEGKGTEVILKMPVNQ